jgi:hypothetical protein
MNYYRVGTTQKIAHALHGTEMRLAHICFDLRSRVFAILTFPPKIIVFLLEPACFIMQAPKSRASCISHPLTLTNFLGS